MAENQDLSGTLNNGSISTPTPTGNDDISTPNQIDYLKVRAYLYKFVPEIIYKGKGINQQFVTTAGNRSTASTVVSQSQSVRDLLTGIAQNISFINLNNTDYDAVKAATSTISGLSALQRLITMKNVQGNNQLIISDTNPAKFVLFSAADIADTNFLINVLKGSTVGVDNSSYPGYIPRLKDIVQNLNKILNSAIKIADAAILAGQTAIKKIQTDAATKATGISHQFEVSRFVHDMRPDDLARFDISKFLSSYQVDQSLGSLCPGSLVASAVLQDTIIPLTDLDDVPGPTSVRRPFFFPDENGDYAGYKNGIPIKTNNGASIATGGVPTIDPITSEFVSAFTANDLIKRIAMAQTLEDNGGKEKVTSYNSAYEQDVDRIELAMRLRGIYNSRKRELIIKYFSSGNVDDELVKIVSLINAPKSFANSVATAELAQGNVTPLGLSSGLNAAQKQIAAKLTAAVGDTKEQLRELVSILTDPKTDGILLSDLIQKYDFFSIFVYRHEVSPDVIEDVLQGGTTDPYFFDKESLFLYTPVSFFLNQKDSRFFATYSPEFNGFVLEAATSKVAGAVNSISVNLTGSMGLMGVTKRIYNSTIFQGSVFDAAEVAYGSQLPFNLYQNLFADKDPFQILTTLLESLYLLRVNIPVKNVELSPEEKDAIVQSTLAKLTGTTISTDKIVAAAVKAAEDAAKKTRTLGGTSDYTRDADGNITSFLDILSLRAFNQFKEVDRSQGIAKGAKHLFNMASFLYANVMRSRRFNVRVPSSDQVALLDSGTLPFDFNAATGQVNGAFDPYTYKKIVRRPKETDGSGGSILEINPYISAPSTLGTNSANANKIVDATQAKLWKSYFIFLSNSLGDFVADIKTGFEIMNDVINSCYLELFETPGGRFVFRTPQYNNNIPIYRTISQDGQVRTQADQNTLATSENGDLSYKTTDNESSNFAHMITSEDIIPISAEYHQTAKNLVTKQQLGYGADLIGVPIEQLYYFYSNGKAVAQYGLNMAKVAYNPNVRFVPKDKLASLGVSITDETFAQGIFHYCRFFLEYNNLHNFTGVITAVGDPKIQVGRTYFDIENQKFGYITQVTKRLTVGDNYTVTFNLSAVRDAVYGPIVSESGSADAQEKIGRPVFRHIPEMEEFIPKFTGSSTKVKNVPSAQTQIPPPTDSFSVLISIEGGDNTRALNPGNATISGVAPGGLQ